MPLGTKLAKQMDVGGQGAILKSYSLGVSTNRDSVVYDFNREGLAKRVEKFCDDYDTEIARFKGWLAKQKTAGKDLPSPDDFSWNEQLAWSSTLKASVGSEQQAGFGQNKIRSSIYRPFTRRLLYYDHVLIDRPGRFQTIFPNEGSEKENRVIWLKVGMEVPMFALAANAIPNLLTQGGAQCFPFYTYAEDGSERRENITDWALQEFQTRYGDPKISKWDIFHYVYAVLHHPQYRERYAANLRRELPTHSLRPERGSPDPQQPGKQERVGQSAAAVTFEPAAAGDTALRRQRTPRSSTPSPPPGRSSPNCTSATNNSRNSRCAAARTPSHRSTGAWKMKLIKVGSVPAPCSRPKAGAHGPRSHRHPRLQRLPHAGRHPARNL